MLNIEIAEAIKNVDLFSMAAKERYAPSLYTDDEKIVASQLDEYFKQIGETGNDAQR